MELMNMIIYDGLKSDFLKSVEEDTIAIEIQRNILERMGRHTTDNEFRSWVNSMQYMYKVMNDAEIPSDAGIAIEYNIPQTAKRVDFMISGYAVDRQPGMVIIELKQWQSLNKVENSDALVETFTGNALRQVVHPSYQAWSYAQTIADYNATAQDKNIVLQPCAFLHNYLRAENDPLDDKQYEVYTQVAPAFTMGQVAGLRSYIKKFIRYGDNKEILYWIDHGKIRPSKSLQDAIVSMLKGNREFVMIDEQKVAYDKIISLAEQCQKDKKKRTIICQGGPGTGKSVIAINLLAELTRKGQFVQYVSKNSAPRYVYEAKLKGGLTKGKIIKNMFQGSGNYTGHEANIVHTVLVDEAHRLNEKSGLFQNLGENQVKELIHASLCSVFFIDESQRVTMADIGSVAEIEHWAAVEGSSVARLELISQFRCNGSNSYLAWLDDVLEINKANCQEGDGCIYLPADVNVGFEPFDYEIKVCDTPEEVREMILAKNAINNKARILAGYCWNWPKDGRNNTDYHDIRIGDFEISWNLANSQTFAIDENSVNEAGCIHTAQGLEFDYAGVIIGDDMRYENGRIVTDFSKRATTDQSLKGIKKLYKANPKLALAKADEIIKNTYRTLMTRGMKGCYIYCTDACLGEYLRSRLPMSNEAGSIYSMRSDTLMVAEKPVQYSISKQNDGR